MAIEGIDYKATFSWAEVKKGMDDIEKRHAALVSKIGKQEVKIKTGLDSAALDRLEAKLNQVFGKTYKLKVEIDQNALATSLNRLSLKTNGIGSYANGNVQQSGGYVPQTLPQTAIATASNQAAQSPLAAAALIGSSQSIAVRSAQASQATQTQIAPIPVSTGTNYSYVSSASKNCPQCGRLNPGNATFCRSCGTDFRSRGQRFMATPVGRAIGGAGAVASAVGTGLSVVDKGLTGLAAAGDAVVGGAIAAKRGIAQGMYYAGNPSLGLDWAAERYTLRKDMKKLGIYMQPQDFKSQLRERIADVALSRAAEEALNRRSKRTGVGWAGNEETGLGGVIDRLDTIKDNGMGGGSGGGQEQEQAGGAAAVKGAKRKLLQKRNELLQAQLEAINAQTQQIVNAIQQLKSHKGNGSGGDGGNGHGGNGGLTERIYRKQTGSIEPDITENPLVAGRVGYTGKKIIQPFTGGGTGTTGVPIEDEDATVDAVGVPVVKRQPARIGRVRWKGAGSGPQFLLGQDTPIPMPRASRRQAARYPEHGYEIPYDSGEGFGFHSISAAQMSEVDHPWHVGNVRGIQPRDLGEFNYGMARQQGSYADMSGVSTQMASYGADLGGGGPTPPNWFVRNGILSGGYRGQIRNLVRDRLGSAVAAYAIASTATAMLQGANNQNLADSSAVTYQQMVQANMSRQENSPLAQIPIAGALGVQLREYYTHDKAKMANELALFGQQQQISSVYRQSRITGFSQAAQVAGTYSDFASQREAVRLGNTAQIESLKNANASRKEELKKAIQLAEGKTQITSEEYAIYQGNKAALAGLDIAEQKATAGQEAVGRAQQAAINRQEIGTINTHLFDVSIMGMQGVDDRWANRQAIKQRYANRLDARVNTDADDRARAQIEQTAALQAEERQWKFQTGNIVDMNRSYRTQAEAAQAGADGFRLKSQRLAIQGQLQAVEANRSTALYGIKDQDRINAINGQFNAQRDALKAQDQQAIKDFNNSLKEMASSAKAAGQALGGNGLAAQLTRLKTQREIAIANNREAAPQINALFDMQEAEANMGFQLNRLSFRRGTRDLGRATQRQLWVNRGNYIRASQQGIFDEASSEIERVNTELRGPEMAEERKARIDAIKKNAKARADQIKETFKFGLESQQVGGYMFYGDRRNSRAFEDLMNLDKQIQAGMQQLDDAEKNSGIDGPDGKNGMTKEQVEQMISILRTIADNVGVQ